MKKTLFLLTLMLRVMPLICHETAAVDTRLEEITQAINHVQKELREEELQAMKFEVTSEKYMKYEWDRYTKEIEKAEVVDQKIYKLREQLKALKVERADLIKKKSEKN